MTLENYLIDEDGAGDHFPVGMRVLLVDNDPLCLKVVGNMLRKCQYQVTTTIQSIKALEMLRTNRNMFDLVITDINMSHMDGFELLEIVGHEMDIPVIILSELSDIERVKKSVILGACDYIIKPPRIRVLRNIWQHVVRRKIDCKDKNTPFNEEKACYIAGEGSQGIASESNTDHNQMQGKKRKEMCVEEENDEMNSKENEEPSKKKKPRLYWNNELQGKFLAAVHQLGCDKAVPKTILHLMNVEGLTRQNVASHLQKYKIGLKKETQQASMVSALGCNASYVQMNSIYGHENFDTSFGSGRILNTTQPSNASGGICCSPNSPSGLNWGEINPSAPVQSIETQNINNSIETLGIPKSTELNQFQQSNRITSTGQFSPIDLSSGCVVSSDFPSNSSTCAIDIPLEDARGELQCKRIDASLDGQLNEATPSITQSTEVDDSYLDDLLKF